MDCYITLDYELFLGEKTGTAEGCLIKPMEALLKILKQYEIKANIMVDAAYLLRMQQLMGQIPCVEEEYKSVTNHIRHLSSEGHAIQYHFHPQWLFSTFVNGCWMMDKEHYKLSDLEKDVMFRSVSDSIDLLNSISEKKAVAFRAGGFSIDNFFELKDLFLSKGISIDTSVLRHAKAKSKYQTYNYTNTPLKTSYTITDNPCIEDKDGNFKEYPITTMPYCSIRYLQKKKKLHHDITRNGESNKRWNDGKGVGYPGGKINAIASKVKKLFGKNVMYASFDGELSCMLQEIYDYSKERYIGKDFVILSHPKIFTPASLKNLDEFIANNIGEIEFKLFQ